MNFKKLAEDLEGELQGSFHINCSGSGLCDLD